MSTLQWAFCGRLVVLRHTRKNPSDAEWDPYIAAFVLHQQRFAHRTATLVWTDGGGPTPAQRARINAAVNLESGVSVAVVSTSMAVRFIVSSMALFNRGIRAFSPDELDGALSHLDATPDERADVRRALQTLGDKLVRT
jgi:hypothetical protein